MTPTIALWIVGSSLATWLVTFIVSRWDRRSDSGHKALDDERKAREAGDAEVRRQISVLQHEAARHGEMLAAAQAAIGRIDQMATREDVKGWIDGIDKRIDQLIDTMKIRKSSGQYSGMMPPGR